MAYTQDLGRNFWYEFDQRTLGTPAFMRVVGTSGAGRIQRTYRDTRRDQTYPGAFLATVQPQRPDWIIIADVQTNTFGEFFKGDWDDTQAAFEDFGQGTLLDTRPGRESDPIHMMDADDAPPIGYHRWHGSVRATQLLDIGDASWWEKLDTVVGLAWAIQSFARPRQQDAPNPPIAQSDLQALRNVWLPMTPEMRDAQFDLPIGYHPSPLHPVAMV